MLHVCVCVLYVGLCGMRTRLLKTISDYKGGPSMDTVGGGTGRNAAIDRDGGGGGEEHRVAVDQPFDQGQCPPAEGHEPVKVLDQDGGEGGLESRQEVGAEVLKGWGQVAFQGKLCNIGRQIHHLQRWYLHVGRSRRRGFRPLTISTDRRCGGCRGPGSDGDRDRGDHS